MEIGSDLPSEATLEIKRTITNCYHCGDVCLDQQIEFDEKDFCCHGCKAVYELINQSDLTSYYHNNDLKAVKVKDFDAIERKYAFLDQKDVVNKLLRFDDEDKSIVKFYLAGIHCSSCIYLLEHLPKLNENVFRSEVNFIRKEISLTFGKSMSLKELVILLASLGYEPTINLESLDENKKVKKSSSIGAKIAVAGFCFGNSMLISLPEYIDVGFQVETNFQSLFGWLNLLLALPVISYSAQDYYKSAWIGLKHRYLIIDVPITIGIFTLFIRSLSEILFDLGPGYVDSLNGLVFFLLIGKWYQGKTYQALSFERDYKSYFPVSVVKFSEGVEQNVMLKDLEAGDKIVIHNQELIPADGLIIEGKGNIDYSFVTGEAEPVIKEEGSKIFAGGRQVGGELSIRLSKAVNSSELTQLWNDSSVREGRKYDTIINEVSKYFTVIILLIAIATGVYWSWADASKIWDSVAAVLIVACPCALALALPFGLGHGMRVLGSKGLYLKNASVIEAIAKIKMVIFDKTGTLTYNDPQCVEFVGAGLSKTDQVLIKTACANSAHPLSKLIANHFGEEVIKQPLSDFIEEVGKGIVANVLGSEVKIGSAEWVGVLNDSDVRESSVYVVIDSAYLGFFRIRATYRKGVFEQLKMLRSKVELHLLSGDNVSEKNKLSPYFDQLHFDQKPKDKLEYIKSINQKVLMIGDGLNDAGALKIADVGFSVCEDVHQFSPACDALLEADSLNKLSSILKFSKLTMITVFLALILSFAYNIVGLAFAVTGNLTPVVSAILMPLSSITIVGFVTAMVNISALRIFGR